jgi:hypothetical protein
MKQYILNVRSPVIEIGDAPISNPLCLVVSISLYLYCYNSTGILQEAAQ